jgi:indolepyruvate ferredoxin oxidoreductase beta subunit
LEEADMKHNSYDIVLSGVGGQGVLLTSLIIGQAVAESGLEIQIAETRGLAQRGGSVICHIRIGDGQGSPLVPEGEAEALVAFEPLESIRYIRFLKPGDSVAVVNEHATPPIMARISSDRYPSAESLAECLKQVTPCVYFIDADALAQQVGNARVSNSILLGALAAASELPISVDHLKRAIKTNAPKGTELLNIEAFDRGYALIKKRT